MSPLNNASTSVKAPRSKNAKRTKPIVGPLVQLSEEQVPEEHRSDFDWLRAFLNKMAEDLKPFRVDVPATWRAVTRPRTLYLGESFARAFYFVSDLHRALPPTDPVQKDLWLVHGEYMGWQRHGWVELDGAVVFDGNFQQFYARDGYYREVGARPWYKYDPVAAVLISINVPMNPKGTIPLGNWHDYLGLPWADPENPTVIDQDKADELLQTSGLNLRKLFCSLGARRPGEWLSVTEWASHIARLGWTSAFVQGPGRSMPKEEIASVRSVFDANLGRSLVTDRLTQARKEVVTMRLERSCKRGSEPHYRFVVVGRQPVPVRGL